MKKFQKILSEGEVIRYLICGGGTTFVNLFMFYCLRYGLEMRISPANLLSILSAVVFAFFANKWFVFQAGGTGYRKAIAEFVSFAGMRGITMLIEFFGVGFLVQYVHIPDMAGKLTLQVVVIVLNYIFSKFFIFKDKNIMGGTANE